MINPYPKSRPKTLLVLELSPLRVRAAIARIRDGALEIVQSVEKTGLDEAPGITAALEALGTKLPSEAVLVSALALPFVIPVLPDTQQDSARREDMLRWELEPQISSLIFAPGPTTLLHWQGKWKSESGDALLGLTVGLSSLNATQWRTSLVSSGAASQEELNRLSAMADTWQGIPPPAGVAARGLPDASAIALAWSQPQVAALQAILKQRKITLLGLLPLAGAAWALLPDNDECRLLERMPGQFLLTTFNKKGKPSLTWHQYHADGIPDSLLRELLGEGPKRIFVADDLGAADLLKAELEVRHAGHLSVTELSHPAALRAAASFGLGLPCPVTPPAGGLLPPAQRLTLSTGLLAAAAFFALGSCLWTGYSGYREVSTVQAQVNKATSDYDAAKAHNSNADKANGEFAALSQQIKDLNEKMQRLQDLQQQGVVIIDRSADFQHLLVAAGKLGSVASLNQIESLKPGEARIVGRSSQLVELQQVVAEVNAELRKQGLGYRFQIQSQPAVRGSSPFTLSSVAVSPGVEP